MFGRPHGAFNLNSGAVVRVSWATQITGLIGFDIGAGFRTCDPSCSDSLNGAPTTTANQQFALAA